MPKVSVILPSFNHEKFIKESIESVLNQTFQDFEIIVTDDGSRDRSVEIIRSFTDPRIRLFVHSRNMGLSIAANNCLKHARGKYIAMLNSDDAWTPRKLELQTRYLDQHRQVGAVFGRVIWVDEDGRALDPSVPNQGVFDERNRNRFKWLRHFFYFGNCLCHASSLVRRECYDEIGTYAPALANLQDFDLWIRLCLQYEIHILNQGLVRFRRIGAEINLSGDTLGNRVRTKFESKQLLNHYLKIKGINELRSIFPEAARYGTLTKDLIPYFLGRLATDSETEYAKLWGLEVLYGLLQNAKTARSLEQRCGFASRDFMKLSRESDAFNLARAEALTTQLNQTQAALNTLRATYSGGTLRLILWVRRIRFALAPANSTRERILNFILRR